MASVFKRSPTSNKWSFEFRDESGRVTRRVGFRDKQETRRLASQLEREADLRRRGLIDPERERAVELSRTPMDRVIAQYMEHLSAKGSTEQHLAEVRSVLVEAVSDSGTATPSDLRAETISTHLQRLRVREVRPIGARAFNKRLGMLKSFSSWLVREGFRPANVLASISRLNEQVDKRLERRAMTDEELVRLLDSLSSVEAPTRARLAAVDRAMLYWLAVSTGLRRGEIASLTPESFSFDSRGSSVTVEAAHTKHGRRDVQPVPAAIAASLKAYLEHKEPVLPIWVIPRTSAKMLRADLVAAGIEPIDSRGRKLDFHALRHTFVSRLVSAGVQPKIAQALARHSTITLTMDRYAHVEAADTRAALETLPELRTADNGSTERPGDVSACQWICQCPRGSEGPEQSRRVRPGSLTKAESRSRKPLNSSGLDTKRPPQSARVLSEADGNRTRNHRIDSPVL